MSKINIKKLREKNDSKIISSEEALKDVEPFEWNEEVLTGKRKDIIKEYLKTKENELDDVRCDLSNSLDQINDFVDEDYIESGEQILQSLISVYNNLGKILESIREYKNSNKEEE